MAKNETASGKQGGKKSDQSGLPVHAIDTWSRRLALCHQQRQLRGIGDNVSRSFGASMEFADRRMYSQGDDLRHIDWSVLARTDTVMVRQYHEDVAPSCTVLLDCHTSMQFTPSKWLTACCLAALITVTAQQTGARVRLYTTGNADLPMRDLANHCLENISKITEVKNVARHNDKQVSQPASHKASHKMAQKWQKTTSPPLPAGDERYFISDGLYPEGGATVLRQLGRGATAFHFLEILSEKEIRPSSQGLVRLRDPDNNVRDQRLDAHAIAAYEKRLAQHRSGWDTALRGLVTSGAGQRYPLIAELPLHDHILQLARAGFWQLTDR